MDVPNVNPFAVVFVAAITLLCTNPVSGGVYQTSDAIVFEIDRTWDGSFPAKTFPLSQSDFVPIKYFLTGGLVRNSHIPTIEPSPEMISYNIGLHPQQGPTFSSWLHHPFVYGAYVAPTVDSRTGPTLKQEAKQNTACGAGPESNRIVNGEEATPNSWPFVVGFMKPGNSYVTCGGSLISETKILTAAHCFERLSMYQLSLMVVKLGMHNVGDGENVPDDAHVTRRISRMTLHKGYNYANAFNDIAIITMDAPVVYSKSISPVCLPAPSSDVDIYAGKDGMVMGWGVLSYGGSSPSALQQATAPIITNAECRQIYSDPGQIPNHMLCASTLSTSSCHGDSGGPLVVKSEEDGRWYQAGIVSWGYECANQAYPAGVYTKVTWLRGWINGNMKN
ncbi:hypothetical protein GHT06_020047 [Daphnia sinensis]|uniref:limulus clotting factor C n=1 Tax=Daphnia sinensis TaxID=1820382 RepID=A0AAD5L207_9CRUS|nr:hypothetical protein GHT06_020047 [Daphnia sinensis]